LSDFFVEKVEEGLDQIKEGKVLSNEPVKENFKSTKKNGRLIDLPFSI